MEMTKKSLMLSLFSIFICLIAGIICACVCKFSTVAIVLLALITIATIVANVIAWKMAKTNKVK